MKLLRVLLIVYALLIPYLSLAECPSGVTKLKLEDLAPCNGYFMSDAVEKRVREDHNKVTQERDKYKKALELSDLQLTKSQQQVVLWEAEAKRQAETVQKTKSSIQYGVLLGFGVALATIVVTGYALKAAGR